MILTPYQLKENEAKVLRPYAVLSGAARGRKFEEVEDKSRLPFQVDRDRIIHSKAFRRLKDKTQVFVSHHGDHYRNRLTHTLEVAQISRDLARMLGLNEDLAEAIALAHDLGHTPFGHAGEAALNECLQPYGMSFEHNEQSKRVVTEIEKAYPDFTGLNLSIEVIEGLMKHETFWDKPAGGGADHGEWVHQSLEAQIVNSADEIAYQNHDIDDGLRSGLFKEEDLENLKLWKMATEAVTRFYGPIPDSKIRIARTVSRLIGIMIEGVAEETVERIKIFKIGGLNDVYKCPERLSGFPADMLSANKELKDFLAKNLYFTDEVLSHSKRGQEILKELFSREIANGKSPVETRDFLAGMTDSFAEEQLFHVASPSKPFA